VSKDKNTRTSKKTTKPPTVPPPPVSTTNVLSSTLRSQPLDASLKQTTHTSVVGTAVSSLIDSGVVAGFSVVRTGAELAALVNQQVQPSAPVPPGGRRVTTRGSTASPRVLHASFAPTPRKSSSSRHQPSPMLRHTPRPHSVLTQSEPLAVSAMSHVNLDDSVLHDGESISAVPPRFTDSLLDEFVVTSEAEETQNPSPEAAANRRRVALRRVTIENLEKHTGVPES
jgi:hypothetical protein